MAEIIYNLIQAAAPRMPWAILSISALAVVIAVVLVVYFLRRLKSTEKEAEDEWGSSQSLFGAVSSPVKSAEPKAPATAVAKAVPEISEPDTPVPTQIPPPIAPTPPIQPSPAVSSALPPPTAPPPVAPPVMQPAMPVPEMPQSPPPAPLHVATQILGSVGADSADSAREPESAQSPAPPASPFGDEVWAELESLQQTGAAETADDWATNPEYEAPRIELIAQPQTNAQAQSRPASIPAAQAVPPRVAPQRDLAAAERAPRARAAFTPGGIDRPASVETLEQGRPERKSGASVLGLAAAASSGPLIFGEPTRRPGESGIDSLSNYGKEPDDPKSKFGTYALVGVLLGFLIGFGAYAFVPPIHGKLKPYVDRLRGSGPDQTVELPRAQVFPGRYDNTKTPTLIKGGVQNLSDTEALPDLAVTFTLKRHNGESETKSVPVNPNPLAPGQAGSYEFEMDLKEFASFKPTGLTTTGGKELKFSTPKQQ